MPLFDAPQGFVQRLRAYDNRLRVRWSDWECRWRIERKITYGRSMDPDLFKESQYEEFVARRDGWLGVLYCKKEQLDERVLFTLWVNDIQRQGGATTLCNRWEAEEEAYRKGRRAKWLDDTYEQARDRWQYINQLSPTKRSTPHLL